MNEESRANSARSLLGKNIPKATDVEKSYKFDRVQSPGYALDPILEYLERSWTVWEPAAGKGNLVRRLREEGFRVEAGDLLDGLNFFRYVPEEWDVQVTNPPYSCDVEWLARSYELGKPFALLLKTDKLGVAGAIRLFERYGVEVVVPDKRVDFETANTRFEDSSAWFHVSWFTWGLGIGRQLTFYPLVKRPEGQTVMGFVK